MPSMKQDKVKKARGDGVKKHKKLKTSSGAQEEQSTQHSLLAAENNVDSKLSSLFAAPKPLRKPAVPVPTESILPKPLKISNSDPNGEHSTLATLDKGDEQLDRGRPARKRKRGDPNDDLEEKYMQKLVKEADKEDAAKASSRRKSKNSPPNVMPLPGDNEDMSESESERESSRNPADSGEEDALSDASVESWTPPKHETQTSTSDELDKANRTVFLGNVSVTAITSKSARKLLEKHLMSFSQPTDGSDTRILESIRFRSTPYSPTLPKKAAFARKEVITATTQSTNAYAIYTTQAHTREAVRRLNGSVVLDRHLRVDSVAHPSPVEHRRCIFVGNLGFVDDESNIVAANEAEGREKRKTNQKPSDVEEGLWRLFGKHGTVESVRVIRDKGTRVGKGIAYVQFTNENAVETALSEDGKKAPPMLPRRLRVTRAKAMRRKPSAAPRDTAKENGLGYRRKVTPGEATQKGRIGKLMGKAAASQATMGIKPPESFVFEGHRAKASQSKTGLKLGKGAKNKGKPTTRSARRAATFRAGGQKR